MAAEKCTAKSKRSGKRCNKYPMKGAPVCQYHGGKTPVVMEKARKKLEAQAVEKDIKATLAWSGVAPLGDPIEALFNLAANINATEQALAARVNALDHLSYTSKVGTEQIKAEMVLWGAYQDRLVRVLESLGKFNLDERRVKIAETQADMIATAIHRILGRMNLTPVQQELISVVVPEEMRRLEVVA